MGSRGSKDTTNVGKGGASSLPGGDPAAGTATEQQPMPWDVALDRILGKPERMRRSDYRLQAVVTLCIVIAAVWFFFCLVVAPDEMRWWDSVGEERSTKVFKWVANLFAIPLLAFFFLVECPARPLNAGEGLISLTEMARAMLDQWWRIFALLPGRAMVYIQVGMFFALAYEPFSGQGILGALLIVIGFILLMAYGIALHSFNSEKKQHPVKSETKIKVLWDQCWKDDFSRNLKDRHQDWITKKQFEDIYFDKKRKAPEQHRYITAIDPNTGRETLTAQQWLWLNNRGDNVITYDEYFVWLYCDHADYAPFGMFLPEDTLDPTALSPQHQSIPRASPQPYSSSYRGGSRPQGAGSLSPGSTQHAGYGAGLDSHTRSVHQPATANYLSGMNSYDYGSMSPNQRDRYQRDAVTPNYSH